MIHFPFLECYLPPGFIFTVWFAFLTWHDFIERMYVYILFVFNDNLFTRQCETKRSCLFLYVNVVSSVRIKILHRKCFSTRRQCCWVSIFGNVRLDNVGRLFHFIFFLHLLCTVSYVSISIKWWHFLVICTILIAGWSWRRYFEGQRNRCQ